MGNSQSSTRVTEHTAPFLDADARDVHAAVERVLSEAESTGGAGLMTEEVNRQRAKFGCVRERRGDSV